LRLHSLLSVSLSCSLFYFLTKSLSVRVGFGML
jgi:hypothetical protein